MPFTPPPLSPFRFGVGAKWDPLSPIVFECLFCQSHSIKASFVASECQSRNARREKKKEAPYIMDRSIGDSQDSPLLQNTYLLYYTLRRTPKKDPKGRRGHHTSVYFLAGSIRGRPGRIRDSLRDPLRKHSLFVADLLVQGGDKKIAHVVDYTKWRP